MDDNQQTDLGKYARHPLRTAGMAFMAGAILGMSVIESKKNVHKSPLQKFMSQLGV